MKLWQKGNSNQTLKNIEKFTVGKDQLMDLHLAKFDLLGNIAHAIMLQKIGLLEMHELKQILKVCKELKKNEIDEGKFVIEDGIEDVHSQIEHKLTKELGDVGKKIHSGRSRNDQVLVDLKMYFRDELAQISELIESLAKSFIRKSNLHKKDYLPGYTHLQIAMPSSFGLWFGAYAESLIDDLTILTGVYKVINKNPLGSGAGYGSSFKLDRSLTTSLLGFEEMDYNVVYAQMSRGKSEFLVGMAISSIAQSLSKFAMDVCMYTSQNFGFIELPTELTTGSSIMPHKKNPDVAEILRGKFNLLKALPTQISSLTSNLPSGYHREFQLLKEIIIPAIIDFKDALGLCEFMIENIKVKKDLLEDPKYDLLFSVENVNDLVNNGVAFRDAYRIVGEGINDGNFVPNRDLNHTLEGSIGNLDNSILERRMSQLKKELNYEKVEQAYEKLLNYEVID